MKFKNLLLALLTAVLLWAAWPVSPFTFLVFIAWIPLLHMADTMPKGRKFFGCLYLTMLLWNLLTTWWIWYATKPGSIGAFLVNSLLMCLPWMGYRVALRRWGAPWSYITLAAFWMCFEYMHLHDWGLSWPWLTLGNAFATHPNWVQWYEYTGTSGGTLWILAVNILLYHVLFRNSAFSIQHSTTQAANGKRQISVLNLQFAISNLQWKRLLPAAAVITVPLLISYLIKAGHSLPSKTGVPGNVVVVQPNIDPWEKISDRVGAFESQLFNLLQKSEATVDENTRLLVWPETALYSPNGIEEDNMKENFFLTPLWAFLKKHPHLKLFTGIESFRRFTEADKTAAARQIGNSGDYYEAYNGSVLLDSSGPLAYYHKSMLVPGAETLPWFLKFLSKWFDKFGGTTGGYAKQNERTVLQTGDYGIAPAICYESIYGEFMSRYAANGATIICVVTNDGWWRNTPGHKQHNSYARLRAIETRKWVARSANTGISCFIDPLGKVYQPQPYNTRAAIKMPVPAYTGKTFFVKAGDLLSKAACLLAAVLCIWLVVIRFRKPSKAAA